MYFDFTPFLVYRELLNSWKLWEPRAEFDIIKNRNNPALIPQPEVTVSCNFCGKNISPAGLGGLSRNTQLFSRFTTTNAKIKVRKEYLSLLY